MHRCFWSVHRHPRKPLYWLCNNGSKSLQNVQPSDLPPSFAVAGLRDHLAVERFFRFFRRKPLGPMSETSPALGNGAGRGHARMGIRVTGRARHLRRDLGYLSGDTLYGRLSVIEMLKYFGQLHGMSENYSINGFIKWPRLRFRVIQGPTLRRTLIRSVTAS